MPKTTTVPRRGRARILAVLSAVLLAAGLVPALGVVTAAPALARSNGLGRTPAMGWDDWNAFGCDNDAADMEANARYLHDSGLQADGYDYVINDGCWDDIVGADPALYPSGQATPAQPDPGGGTEATLPTTAEETACGVVDGRGTGQPGTSGRSVPAGQLFVNPYLFPPSAQCANDGLKIVAQYVHSLGQKFGLWLDASDTWNGEEIPGSYGPCSDCAAPGGTAVPSYDQEDADTFASWGVDYIKADWAGDTTTAPSNDPMPFGGTDFANQGGPLTGLDDEQIAQTMYGALSSAVRQTGRPIVLNLCVHNPLAYVQTWGASVGNSWKSDANLSDTYASMVSMVNDVDQYAQYAGPGGFNDPDMLTIGDGGMTQTEDESEFSLWAELSAPLIMGANLATPAEVTTAQTRTGISQELPPATPAQDAYDMAIFGNKDVIAVDQDPLGKQAAIVSFDGTHLVLAKPLTGGDVAVTLFNEADTAATMSTSVAAIGLQARSPVYTLTNLWSKQVTETRGTISAFVAPHQTVMYRVAAPRSARQLAAALASAPATTLAVTSPSNPIAAGGATRLTVSLTNNGATPVAVAGNLGLTLPAGWTEGPGSASGRRPHRRDRLADQRRRDPGQRDQRTGPGRTGRVDHHPGRRVRPPRRAAARGHGLGQLHGHSARAVRADRLGHVHRHGGLPRRHRPAGGDRGPRAAVRLPGHRARPDGGQHAGTAARRVRRALRRLRDQRRGRRDSPGRPPGGLGPVRRDLPARRGGRQCGRDHAGHGAAVGPRGAVRADHAQRRRRQRPRGGRAVPERLRAGRHGLGRVRRGNGRHVAHGHGYPGSRGLAGTRQDRHQRLQRLLLDRLGRRPLDARRLRHHAERGGRAGCRPVRELRRGGRRGDRRVQRIHPHRLAQHGRGCWWSRWGVAVLFLPGLVNGASYPPRAARPS